jgi:site-specific DNA recombinase
MASHPLHTPEGPSMTDTPRIAAVYARVSTEDQAKGFSLPTQVEACKLLAEQECYTVPEDYILVDEGISGTTLERPGLHKLRELIRTSSIGAIVIHDPDRLSRNLGHQLLLANEADKAQVKLLIVSHSLEQGPEGWLFFQMRGALGEYERAKLLERAKRGLRGRAKAGYPNGGQVPLGYVSIPAPHGGHWEIDPEEAAVVQRIFALCLAGLSTRAIATQLTEERVPTRLDRRPNSGGKKLLQPGIWTRSTVVP